MPTLAPIPPDDANAWSVDYETYYDKEYSLKKIPTWSYVYDGRFDAYMVSVAGPDNFLWVGHPSKFDWGLLNGAVVLHHNAAFDALVTKRLQEDGVIPEFTPAAIYDTIDMARFLKLPAPLKDIAKFVYGLKDMAVAGKNAREKMKGKRPDELMADPEILEYCTNDARFTLQLWNDWSHLWPDHEREVSRLTREAGWRGIEVDMPYVDDCANKLHERLFEAAKNIPWEWPPDKTPLSPKKIVAQAQQEVDEIRELTDAEAALLLSEAAVEDLYEISTADFDEVVTEILNKLWGTKRTREYPCRIRDGKLVRMMWYPSSFDQKDPDCEAWEDQYGDRFAWIGAVRDWRRQNTLLQKFQHLQKFTGADGVFHYSKKYCGAHSGRWSGDGRFNMENLPRDEMFCEVDSNGEPIKGTGFNLRRCFKGDLIISDYAQIEARVLLYLVKDEEQLRMIREQGISVYEAHAKKTMGWEGAGLKELGETDPVLNRLYRLAKARVLGGGYGCGGSKFAATAWTMARLRLTEEEGAAAVKEFRADNPLIVRFWKTMDGVLRRAVAAGRRCMEIKLPSGRTLYYWSPKQRTVKKIVKTPDGDKLVEDTSFYTMIAKGNASSFRKTYGANLVENICQAVARDILADAWRALDAAGYVVAMTVHDEFVLHRQPGQTVEEAERIILDAGLNSWAKDIPLGLESKESMVYTK